MYELLFFQVRPAAVACDLHPDYASSQWARQFALDHQIPCISVQHHHAHLAACLVDNDCKGPALGAIWDGVGLGTDGAIWGGEFLLGDERGYQRVAHFHPFVLLGAEAAVREPRRIALSLLWAAFGAQVMAHIPASLRAAFSPQELQFFTKALESGNGGPLCTSVGRLFDGVAALTGLVHESSFEAQAAMALEFIADPGATEPYPLRFEAGVLDWRAMIVEIANDVGREVPVGAIAGRFHASLVQALVRVCRAHHATALALSGGCFQNRYLLERAVNQLEHEGVETLLHRQFPPNDGALSLGQLVVAASRLRAG